MSTSEQTKQCPICGISYKVYAWFAGDQSACPDCIRKAERSAKCDKIIELARKHVRGD